MKISEIITILLAGIGLFLLFLIYRKEASNNDTLTKLKSVGSSTDMSAIVPKERFSGFISALGATDMLGEYLEPTVTPCIFRIEIALDVATAFTVSYKIGSEIVNYYFKEGNNLTANSLYAFDILVHQNDKINFQVLAACTAFLRVQELAGIA